MLVHGHVDFKKKILDWDGFGFNYVETAQTPDYKADPQDYGGFSILNEDQQTEIIEAVFGEDGLKPSVIKMFLDPFHQTEDHINAAPYQCIDQRNYDHETTTKQMRKFVKAGLDLTKKSGRVLDIITTLYGPPAFMTVQKVMRGRDLHPDYKVELAKYMVSWAQYLKGQGYPVKYISIHNEGEDYHRWPYDGTSGNIGTGHDYNLYWPPEAVSDFMKLLRDVLDMNNMPDVAPTPGETTNWTRFLNWGYADAIADNMDTVHSIGLITSHGFSGGQVGEVWYGDHRSAGTDEIRKHRPEVHAWVTSTSWAKMDAKFLLQIHGNIYSAKCNCIIPWAGIQRPSQWVGGDPNPGNAIQINEDGTYELRDGYYYYKQICPIGQKGMAVVKTHATCTSTAIIAFSANETNYKNAFVVINSSDQDAVFDIRIENGRASKYASYVTSPSKKCKNTGIFELSGDLLHVTLEPNCVMTFVEAED